MTFVLGCGGSTPFIRLGAIGFNIDSDFGVLGFWLPGLRFRFYAAGLVYNTRKTRLPLVGAPVRWCRAGCCVGGYDTQDSSRQRRALL